MKYPPDIEKRLQMISSKYFFAFLSLSFFSLHAFADESAANHKPIGNYNYIEIGLGSTSEATPVCAGTECYKTLNGAELTASLNFASVPHLLISASSSSQGASGANSNLTASVGKLLIGLIGGFGSVDVEVSVSELNADILTCPNGSNICQDVINNGTDFGGMAKLWFGSDNNFNVGATVDRYFYTSTPSTTYINSSVFASWLPARHHSLALSYNSTMDINHTSISNGGSVSYAYLF